MSMRNSDWEIRPAVLPEDEYFLFEVYVSTRQREMDQWGWEKEQQLEFLRMQYGFQLRSYQMKYSSLEDNIIFCNGVKAGHLVTARSKGEITVVEIAILPQHCSRGIGTELLQFLQQEAQSAGVFLELSVRKDNPAKGLYERLGFQEVSSSEVYSSMRWQQDE